MPGKVVFMGAGFEKQARYKALCKMCEIPGTCVSDINLPANLQSTRMYKGDEVPNFIAIAKLNPLVSLRAPNGVIPVTSTPSDWWPPIRDVGREDPNVR